MASIEMLDQWDETLREIDALYREVAATTTSQREPSTDLSGTSSTDPFAPMPGGDRVAAVAVFSEHAPPDPDRFPHPLLFVYTWAWHCAEANASIPPRRAWTPALEYLRAHMHWIDGHDAEDFHHEMRRVHGNLKRLCTVDRRSQAEEVWIGKQNEKNARKIIRDLAERDALPEWIHPKGKRYREPFMVTREEGAAIFPELHLWIDEYGGVDEEESARVNAAWFRIADRSKKWADRHGEPRKFGMYKLNFVRDEARKVTE